MKKIIKKINYILFLSICFSSFNLEAATRYWIGGSSTAWNNNVNWGTSSGSGAPASFPTTGDIAVFDGGGLVNCTLTANVTVATLSVLAAYTRTISQGTFTIIITGNSYWAGGTFIGGSGSLGNVGSFNLSGTNFTSPSASLGISGAFSLTGGTFNHNNGTTVFANNSFAITGSPIFYNLATLPNYNTLTFASSFTVAGNLTLSGLGAWGIINISAGQALTVNGTLFITGDNQITINTGSIIANGDITVTNTSNFCGGSATIKIAGSGAQTLTGSGVFNQGDLPSIVINKPSGTLNLASYITVLGPTWNFISGTLAAGSSTVCFYNTGVPFTISGSQTLTTVIFYGNYSNYIINNSFTANDVTLDATARCDMTVSNTLTINGTLLITGSGYFQLNTGTVNVKGNVINNNTNTGTGGGSASFVLNGTTNQTITGTPLINQGPFPPLTIDKASGTLFLTGFITFYNGLSWVAGTVDSGTSTCVFNNVSAIGSQTVDANATGMSFYNIVFDQPDYLWTNIITNLSVLGSMTITAGSGIKTNGHTISLGGNFTCLNTTASGASFVFNGATGCSLILNGSGPGTQSIIMNNPSASANKALFYNLTLSSTAGRSTNDDITLNDILTVSNSVVFTTGKMLTTSTKYLSLKDGASSTIGNNLSYVNGIMRYEMALNGSRTLNFPIGSGSSWRYITLNLTHNTGTSYTYIGQVVGSSAMALGYTMPSTITHVSYQRYTQVDRVLTSSGAASNVALSGNQAITMHYDADDVVTDYTQLTIAKTTGGGSPWIDIGGTANANTTGTIISTSSPSAFNSFSKFVLANKVGGSNPLPIELLDFTAKQCGKDVCLDWSTATEVNNMLFTVQKSRNGFDFEDVGSLRGANNSKTLVTYSLEDDSPYNDVSYYRLKQTDMDGQFKYFKIVAVSIESSHEGWIAFPNPSNDGKFIFKASDQTSDLSLCNALGETISILTLSGKKTEIDLSYLASGVYYVTDKNTGVAIKILIAK